MALGGSQRCTHCRKLAYLVNGDRHQIATCDYSHIHEPLYPLPQSACNSPSIPRIYRCSASGALLRNPVVGSDNKPYELAVLQHWYAQTMLHKGSFCSPSPGCPPLFNHVYPDFALKRAAAQWAHDNLGMVLAQRRDSKHVDPSILTVVYQRLCHMLHTQVPEHPAGHCFDNRTICTRKSSYSWHGGRHE
jgi:hypothetical protein